MEYPFNMLGSLLAFRGRVLQDAESGAAYFNWTGSGFRCAFSGTRLCAKLKAIPGHVEGIELPWIGITVDGGVALEKRIRVEDGEAWYTLYETAHSGVHEINIWKLTENLRGKCALLALETDGNLLKPETDNYSFRIEFVGDSITCGYGNEAAHRDDPFRTEEENGYITYAMCASRQLDAEPTCMSVSGISVAVDADGPTPQELPGMEDLYAYTDAPFEQEFLGKDVCTKWDFATHPKDAVIINLGTNDVNMFKLASSRQRVESFFSEHYTQFLRHIRSCNGPDTFILCTLGPLDYYLYDQIRGIVRAYQEKSGDRNIACFKYGGVVQWSEGYGAVGHPSAATHRRMGEELAAELRRYLYKT